MVVDDDPTIPHTPTTIFSMMRGMMWEALSALCGFLLVHNFLTFSFYSKAFVIPSDSSVVVETHERDDKVRFFGVGLNKSGTTSLNQAMKKLGFTIGNQYKAERLLPQWINRDFQAIVNFVRDDGSLFFQDVPFSMDFTHITLDTAFPGSKFILTERSGSDVWFESLRNFHGKHFNGTKLNETIWNSATVSDLKRSDYNYKGFIYDRIKAGYYLSDNDEERLLHNKKHFIGIYERHNLAIKQYFHHRPHDLLVLNVEEDDAMEKLCNFVGKPCPGKRFPHRNPTVDKWYQ